MYIVYILNVYIYIELIVCLTLCLFEISNELVEI